MNDNFYIDDLILSIKEETTVKRYLPLSGYRDDLRSIMKNNRVLFRDDVTEKIIEEISDVCGKETASLFVRFIHIYDFKPEKLREIKQYEGTEKYHGLADLLRLPGVRVLRAELYYNSGVTLQMLAEGTTEEIQKKVSEYVRREGRKETVPLTKEVNCHREVAKMIIHIK